MGYPAKLLGADEEIELALRTHWKALIGPVLAFVLTCGAASFLASVAPQGKAQQPLWILIAAVSLFVIVRWTLWPWLGWITTSYVLTNRRLIMRQGVVRREGRDIPLARVNDVSFSHSSLLERMLRCGTLVVESAGEHGQLTLEDIPHVEVVQRDLYRLAEADAARRRREIRDDEYEIDGT
jgi:uncharacterized membrane protein YdbT with pleckstrin-like domain